MEKVMAGQTTNKAKIHTVYKTADSKRVPSVTTILGILNKPALLDWAWKCGCDGLDYKEVRDNAADIGILAHYLICCHLKGKQPDTSEYSSADLDKAENSLIKYWDWEKGHELEQILIETPLVSEDYQFGGTIDFYGKVDGQPTLLDFKTGKALYKEATMQVVTYAHLLNENGHSVDTIKILRIGRDETEGFEEKTIYDYETGWQIFLRCLDIYNLQKVLKA